MKFILIATDNLDKVRYYGPFNDSKEAIEWGLKNFDSEYTLSVHSLQNAGDEDEISGTSKVLS